MQELKTWYGFYTISNYSSLNYYYEMGIYFSRNSRAVVYYLYSQMSEEEKTDMVNKVKEKGKKVYDKYVPDNMKNIVPDKA